MSVMVCSVAGCERETVARGWCHMHYQRWRKNGDPLTTLSRGKGRAGNARWAGEDATYKAAHQRLGRERGTASAHVCAGGCGRRGRQWAYRGDCPNERWGSMRAGAASPGQFDLAAYSTDLERYDPLCTSCHVLQRPPLLAMLAERATERAAVAA